MKKKWLAALLVLCIASGALAQPKQAQPAHPQDPQKFDTTLPVEITSDSLEVLQHENKAIFRGNVIAVQGQVRLKSDVMVVHYKQQGGDKQNASSASSPAAVPTPTPAPKETDNKTPGEMGAVTLIEVEGNVLVATPQESAKGEKGDYTAATRLLHLYGPNVVLTRDKNIMRGTALVYNMETGRSILTNGPDIVTGKSNGDRVRSVFVPEKEAAPSPTPAPVTIPSGR